MSLLELSLPSLSNTLENKNQVITRHYHIYRTPLFNSLVLLKSSSRPLLRASTAFDDSSLITHVNRIFEDQSRFDIHRVWQSWWQLHLFYRTIHHFPHGGDFSGRVRRSYRVYDKEYTRDVSATCGKIGGYQHTRWTTLEITHCCVCLSLLLCISMNGPETV